METQTYDQTILTAHTETIASQFSIRKILVNAIGLLVGVGTIMVATAVGETTSALYLFLMTVGVVLVVLFLVRLISKTNEMVYTPTKSALRKISIFFKTDELQNLIYAVETGKIELLQRLAAERNSGVRMDFMYSKDEKFAACQLFSYVPYNYEPASKVYTIEPQISRDFCKMMQELGAKQ